MGSSRIVPVYEALDKIFFFDFFYSFNTSMSKTTNPKILRSDSLPMKSWSIPTFGTIGPNGEKISKKCFMKDVLTSISANHLHFSWYI